MPAVSSILKARARVVLRFVVAALFVYAASTKLIDPRTFMDALDHYRLVPYFALAPLAYLIPSLEVVSSVALVFPRWRKAATAVLLGLTFVFAGALTSAWIRGLAIDCGCLGEFGRSSVPVALLRDALIGACLIWLWLGEKTG